ncbi:unknown protein [Seminavis robusta]|uniref:Secreted protein n=1 Tax=Seminavis robusta TaxID=568900 RepID=A0A9N8EF33_9STRA|nr:unknown protein [Seminavis robusta]|eukprot:Sro1001_g229780.1 n/a (147) ;mRNA; f:10926-11432
MSRLLLLLTFTGYGQVVEDRHGVLVVAHGPAAAAVPAPDVHGVVVAAHGPAAAAVAPDVHGVVVVAHGPAAAAAPAPDVHGVVVEASAPEAPGDEDETAPESDGEDEEDEEHIRGRHSGNHYGNRNTGPQDQGTTPPPGDHSRLRG